MKEYTSRQPIEYLLPSEGGIDIIHPERVILRFGAGGHTLDIGALCYLERFAGGQRKWGGMIGVDLSSFDAQRAKNVRKIIRYFSDQTHLAGKRAITVGTIARVFFKFVDWCDANEHFSVLQNIDSARLALRAHSHYLRERILLDRLNVNTASKYQTYIISCLNEIFSVDDMHHGVRQIRKMASAENATTPPPLDMQGRVVSLCQMIFEGISSFVIGEKPYIYKLEMPAYLGWKDSWLWLFPTMRGFMTPNEEATRDELKNSNWSMNYAAGRVATLAEIESRYVGKGAAMKSIRDAESIIAEANSNAYHYRRRNIAMLAHNCFVLLFLSATGMNWATVRELKWGTDFDVGVEGQGFREIKYRAGGRMTSFSIRTIFLTKFKRYLELRRYILNGEKCDYLFCSLGNRLFSAPKKIGPHLLSPLHKTLRRIDPSISPIMSRAWRAAKSDWLIKNTDLSTTALLLQNSEKTVLRHYTAGSEVEASREMAFFFNRLSKIVLISESGSGEFEGALGECIKHNEPNMLQEKGRIQPDCHQPEGCLFCDKYVVHANERDARKLLSCRYCIYQTRHLSSNDEHFDSLFSEVIKRIDLIVEEIGKRSNEHSALVDRVRREVNEDGLLDPYWEGKFQMLIDLGVVT